MAEYDDTDCGPVAAFAAAVLGHEIDRIVRLRSFVTNAVYAVDAGGNQFIAKASRNEAALRSEAWACGRGTEAGSSAPAVLGVGRLACDDGMSAFLMRRVTGAPIVATHPAYRDVGSRLRRLHDVTFDGFGWLAEARWNGREDFSLGCATWLEFLSGICADAREIVNPPAIAVAADAIAKALELHADALAAVDVGSLCHGDLKAAHVFVDGEHLTGVIDWGDAVVADPVFDIARFAQRVDAASLRLLLEGYDPSPAFAAGIVWRLPLYGALWTLIDAIVDHRLQTR